MKYVGRLYIIYNYIRYITLPDSVYLRLLDMLVHGMVPEEVDEQPEGQELDDKLVQETDDELEQLVLANDVVV